MKKNDNKGFTLIELMAVIIIISLVSLLTFPNIINQIKKTKNSNNKIIEDVVIEQVKKYVSDNKEELTDEEYCMLISTLIDNGYVKEDLVKVNNIKDNKVIHITFDDNNFYEVVDKNKCFLSAVKYLLNKTNPINVSNYIDGDVHEMYTFDHDATEQTPALTDYRYIGSDPYNYVTFNGNETWRIIGIFNTEDANGKWDNKIKIVRNEVIGSMPWDNDNINEWITASLSIYLNNVYYNQIQNNYKNMISSVKYYVGGGKNKLSGNDFYNSERGNNVYSERNINWIGKIGLIYPSDYIFPYALGVNVTCFDNSSNCEDYNLGWFYNEENIWTIFPESRRSTHSLRVYGNNIFSYNSSKNSYQVKPSLYLSSKVKIISGDGTESNPYKLSL